LYLEEVEKNIQFAEGLADRGDAESLRRNPPVTLTEPGSR